MIVGILKAIRRQNAVTLIAGAGVLVILLVVILAPSLVGDAADSTDALVARQGISPSHWLGTDSLGRDIFARVLVATRLSVLMAFAAVGIGFVLGVAVGSIAAIVPQRASRYLGVGIDLFVAFPPLLLAIVLAVILGLGVVPAILAIGLSYAPYYARVTRALAADIAGQDYIAASKMLKVPSRRIITKHVFPNVSGPLIVNATMGIGSALLAFAALSFLGLGVQPPSYDWGRLLRGGLDYIYIVPAAALGPAIAVVLCGMAFNFLGESLVNRVSGRERNMVAPGASRRWGLILGARETRRQQATAAPTSRVDAENVRVTVPSPTGNRTVVNGIDLQIESGEIVGIVGESGAGKSLAMMGLADLTPVGVNAHADSLHLAGKDVGSLGRRDRQTHFAENLSVVFQDPMVYLNPALRIGTQLTEGLVSAKAMSKKAARRRAVDLLADLQIPSPAKRLRQYPHQLSGGMRQRVMIAMALMTSPTVMIADEPTTALDVTVQAQVLRILRRIRDDSNMSLVFVSHDFGVIEQLCDRIVVMYAGRIVEKINVRDIHNARHPYTRALLESTVRIGSEKTRNFAAIPGRPPDDIDSVVGCPFAPRCAFAQSTCLSAEPALRGGPVDDVACFFPVSD